LPEDSLPLLMSSMLVDEEDKLSEPPEEPEEEPWELPPLLRPSRPSPPLLLPEPDSSLLS
jgi:hypothetical protein